MESHDPIRHVVVLMLENRSFDQMLGVLQTVHAHLDGIDPAAPPRKNSDPEGREYPQAETRETVIKKDPGHGLQNVLRQIEAAPAPEPERRCCAGLIRNLKSFIGFLWAMLRWCVRRRLARAYPAPPYEGKFVLDFSLEHKDSTREERALVMSFYPLDFLPALHILGRHFTVCDQWFSSVPGPTWPNRFYVHSGTSQGLAHMPKDAGGARYFVNDQDTLFDRLNDRGIRWKIYAGDFPLSLLLEHQRRPENAKRYFPRSEFFDDASGTEDAFPQYAFIEPDYFFRPNDDHPPNDTMDAQALIADIYNALRANHALWNSTLLVVTYDEHGGFFDHVPPPAAIPPDGHADEYTFDRLGVRVPALLVSPWVTARVLPTEFDHTSILKYLIEKWNLGRLGERAARANSIGQAIRTSGRPRTDTPEAIHMPPRAFQAPPPDKRLNDHQRALVAFSEYLEPSIEDTRERKVARAAAGELGPQAEMRVAQERAWKFIDQQKALPESAPARRPSSHSSG